MGEPNSASPRPSAGNALSWTFLGTFARIAAQFVIGVTLARWIGPGPYGVMAAAMLPISLAGLVTNGGLAAAAIQAPNLDKEALSRAWWVQLGVGFACALLIGLGAPLMARGLSQPEVVSVMRVMALALPINAAGSMATALLIRNLRTRPIQMASVMSYVFGYGIVGLCLARAGAGVWAVALAQLTQMTLNALVLLVVARPRLGAPGWPSGMARFGAWALLGNLTCWAHANIHQALTSSFLGKISLGNYSRFGLLTELPVSVFAAPIQQVLLPAVARETTPTGRALLTEDALAGIALMFLPAMGLLAVTPELTVGVVFGQQFLPQAHLLTPMSLSAAFLALGCVSGPALTGIGRPRDEWMNQFSTLVVTVPLLAWGAANSMMHLGWCLVIAGALRFAVGLWTLRLRGLISFTRASRAVSRGALPALPALALGWVLASRLPCNPFGLALLVAAVLILWVLTLWVFRERLLPETLRHFLGKRIRAGLAFLNANGR